MTVSVTDNDTPGVTVSEDTLTVPEGGSETYTVVLDTEPTASVTVDIGGASGDVSANPTSLTFTALNWSTAQAVTVSAAEDEDAVADPAVTLTHTASGGDYGSVSGDGVNVTITENDTAGVTISPTNLTIDEGGSESYTVVLTSQPNASVTVDIGGRSGDVSTNPTSLTFTTSNWDTERTVTVSAAEDDDAVADAAVILTHTVRGGDYQGLAADSVTVNITEKDAPGVTVSPTDLHISEGNSGEYTIVLTTEPSETVSVTISGHAGTDLSVPNTSLTLTTADWNTPHTVTVSAAEDLDAAPDDEVTLTHTLSGGDYAGVTSDSVIVTIYENDPVSPPDQGPSSRIITYPPPAGMTVEPTELTIPEGESGTYSVGLETEPSSSVTVKVKVPEDADLTVSPDTLEFTADNWEDLQTVTVSTTEDDDAISDGVGISHDITGGGYSITDGATVAVTITDDDTPGVTVSPTTLTVPEGGSETYTVVLDTEPSDDVTVTVGGESGDVSANPKSLTLTALNWSTAQTVTVSAAEDNDAVADPAVTLTHAVSGGDYAGVTADNVTVTIIENDTPTLAVANAQASEADGAVEFEVTLSTASSNEVTVDYDTSNGTAAAGSDYTTTSGTLTFTVGSTANQTISVPVTDDTDDKAERETFMLTLSGAVNAALSGGETTLVATGTIIDDDDPQVTISFGSAAYTVVEGGTIEVTVTLSADPERPVTIPLTTIDQGGAAGSDYSGVPASLTFNSGDTEKTFTFSATQDTDNDDGESVKLGFGTMPTGVSAGTTDAATVSITDDDDPTVNIRFEQGTYTVAEGSTVDVKLKLNADPERTIAFPLSRTNQGGASSSDYFVPASVEFASGETEKTITFSATQDTVDDDDEKVKLGFGTMPAGASAVSPTEAMVSITDDDHPQVTVSFASATYTAPEGDSVQVKVTLSQAPERQVAVPITKTNQGGASNSDYSGVPTSLTFGATDTEKTFTFTAQDDSNNDDGESVKLGFGTLPDGVSGGATTTVTITDNDSEAGKVTLLLSHNSILENGASPL